jgi:hypothetical protein
MTQYMSFYIILNYCDLYEAVTTSDTKCDVYGGMRH